ncbi:MAG: hypothetical protein HY782_07705 [Chloroflexi bacterium]|nr:hypothetical protein [Chloroflexota bacterium]
MDAQLANILAGGLIAALTSIVTLLIQRFFETQRRREEWAHERQKALDDEERARRKQAEQKETAQQDTFQRYRYPLFRAAYDLQSRLYNLMSTGRRLLDPDHPGRSYMVDSTVYLIGQYFCWLEIVRHQGGHFRFEKPEQTETFNRIAEQIESEFSTRDNNNPLCVYRLQQRELGEMLIVDGPQGEVCVSYSGFSALLNDPVKSKGTLGNLRQEIGSVSNLDAQCEFVKRVQHLLIDLLDLLDPPGPAQLYPDLRGKLS